MEHGPLRDRLLALGAEITPFECRYFGATYPQGNKIEGLAALPPGPFVFFDSDSVIADELADLEIDFGRPAASMRREGTWPRLRAEGPDIKAIWGVLHERFGGCLEETLDIAWPEDHWRRYLYFNAGWFFGADPEAFRDAFLAAALSVRDDPPPELDGQALDPWLDQVALPLAVHALDGGRPGARGGIAEGVLDGGVAWHYRTLGLLYATAPDRVIERVEAAASEPDARAALSTHPPFRRAFYEGDGARARAMFDRAALPEDERPIRQALRKAGLWHR